MTADDCTLLLKQTKLVEEGWHVKHILDRGEVYDHQQELFD